MMKYYRKNCSKALKHYIGSLLSVFYQEKKYSKILEIKDKNIFVKDFFISTKVRLRKLEHLQRKETFSWDPYFRTQFKIRSFLDTEHLASIFFLNYIAQCTWIIYEADKNNPGIRHRRYLLLMRKYSLVFLCMLFMKPKISLFKISIFSLSGNCQTCQNYQ